MASDIDMSSNALLLIGDDPISSFTEPGAGAQAAANLYPDTYRRVLSEHPWTFATKEQQLNKLSQTPDPLTNYQYAYQLPVDLIRLWAIFGDPNYTIVNGILYSNTGSGLLARYVYAVDEANLPPHFIKAMEYMLASDFAVSVTEDLTKAGYYEQKYKDAIAQARGIDSQGRPPTPIADRPFTDVRHSGSYSGPY